MNQHEAAHFKRMKLLSAVSEAADKEERCPDSNALAAASGYAPSSIRAEMRYLRARGYITMISRGNLRVVTITATGKSTADLPLAAERFVKPCRPKVTVAEILGLAENIFNISRRDILSRARMAHIVRPRQAVCIAAARHGWGPAHIGRALKRDHSTVMYARDMGTAFERCEPDFAARLSALEQAVRERAA